MPMAACGEDEFGNLYADVHVKDVLALRAVGSVHWSLEDESDTSLNTPSGKGSPDERLPGASSNGCYAKATPQAELDAFAIQRASKKDYQAEGENNSNVRVNDASGIYLRLEDVETESDDDLHIVLNPSHKVVNEGSSEDGEDFVILAGNEVAGGQEWREDSFMPTEDNAQANIVGGEKLGASTDEQVQSKQTSGVHPHISYGGQAYHRHYRYVREIGVGRVGAVSNGNARVTKCKSGSTKSERIGGNRGLTNPHRIAGKNGAVRGGPEYILPSKRTVFDVDIDAFKEKPWRLSNIDVSDYFNFGLDESSWKGYCKQLGQFCSEVTTQSKISVYEGGRIGQAMACDIQAGGVSVGRRTSADVQGQQFRNSDAIFLVDVREDNMSQSYSEGHRDVDNVCKVLDSRSPNVNVASKNEACMQEKERPFVTRRSQTSQKRSNAILQEFSANELKENGSVAVVSRPKTPSPATPPERLPTQGKRDMMVCGKSRSSSFNDSAQIGKEEYNSSALHKRKENAQLAGYVTSGVGQHFNAGAKSSKANHSSRRTDLKRGSYHAIAAQISKKRKLNSHQANHGCHYSGLLIRKLSRVHTSKAAFETHVAAESLQQENLSSISGTIELPNGKTAFGKFSNGASGEHVTEVAERKKKPIKVESKRSKRKRKADSSEVRDVLQGMLCESIKENSREKLKVKKSKKGHKGKEKVKSKDKVHLPGCPNVKKGLENNNLMQGTGNMSMISFISKGNEFYWKRVDSLRQRNVEDEDAKKMSLISLCHESQQRTEDRSTSNKSDGHHVDVGGQRERKKRILKPSNGKRSDSNHAVARGYDHLLESNVMNSWKALKVLRGKKKDLKHMLLNEMRLASSRAQLLANSTCETHPKDSEQIAIKGQVTLNEKGKKSEDKEGKEKDTICEQINLESEHKVQGLTGLALAKSDSKIQGLTDLALAKSKHKVQGLTDLACANGLGRKKKPPRKSRKSSCKSFNEPITSSLVNQQEEDSNIPNVMVDLESCRPEPLCTKVCGSQPPNASTDTLNGSGYDGFEGNGVQVNSTNLLDEQENALPTMNDSSDDEEKQRGRSKFERWTSHSEQFGLDIPFRPSDTQNGSRISLSRKVSISKLGQCSRQPSDSAFGLAKESAARNLVGRWKVARKYTERMKTSFNHEDYSRTTGSDEQQNARQDLDQFVAKLQKRRERFNLLLEEKGPLQRLANKDLPLAGRLEGRFDRPARKRCWGGG